jgi:hypothetical protein
LDTINFTNEKTEDNSKDPQINITQNFNNDDDFRQSLIRAVDDDSRNCSIDTEEREKKYIKMRLGSEAWQIIGSRHDSLNR